MSNIFLYEDGKGSIADESGNQAMDFYQEVDPFNLQTLMTLSHYKVAQKPIPGNIEADLDETMGEFVDEIQVEQVEQVEKKLKNRSYNIYSDKQRAVFYYFNRIKLMKAAPSGKKAGINERTAQDWARRLKNDPSWNIFDKETNKVNRKGPQLHPAHKDFLVDYYDNYPQSTIDMALESLTEKFEDLTIKRSTTGRFILHDCNLTMKRITSSPRSKKRYTRINEWLDWVKRW